jgi:hypothetical protein
MPFNAKRAGLLVGCPGGKFEGFDAILSFILIDL